MVNFDQHSVKSVQIRSFSWSVFSHIRTEYGEILRIPAYSFRMREKNGPEKTPYLDTLHSVQKNISELIEIRNLTRNYVIRNYM